MAYHGGGHSSRAAERELVHVCAGDNPDAVQRAPRSSRPRRAPAARRARGLRPEFDQHGANLKVFFLDVCHGWGGVRVGMARTTQVKLKLQTCVVVAGTARLRRRQRRGMAVRHAANSVVWEALTQEFVESRTESIGCPSLYCAMCADFHDHTSFSSGRKGQRRNRQRWCLLTTSTPKDWPTCADMRLSVAARHNGARRCKVTIRNPPDAAAHGTERRDRAEARRGPLNEPAGVLPPRERA